MNFLVFCLLYDLRKGSRTFLQNFTKDLAVKFYRILFEQGNKRAVAKALRLNGLAYL